MSSREHITGHYHSGQLWERLCGALRSDGCDPERPSIEGLAPYDQFHGRGMEVTAELFAGLAIDPGAHILDVGSGLGGPARYLADRAGCRVTGVDLTEEFCAVARMLNDRMGFADRVTIEHASALEMPFAEACFDGAYSMNVSMNIEDKAALYREIRRVLKPGGWLLLSEVARGPAAGEIPYPTPWASSAASSFLATPAATREGLEACGFEIVSFRETAAEAAAYAAHAREIVAAGGKPPHRAVTLVHGDIALSAMNNTGLASKNGLLVPVEVHCVRRA